MHGHTCYCESMWNQRTAYCPKRIVYWKFFALRSKCAFLHRNLGMNLNIEMLINNINQDPLTRSRYSNDWVLLFQHHPRTTLRKNRRMLQNKKRSVPRANLQLLNRKEIDSKKKIERNENSTSMMG